MFDKDTLGKRLQQWLAMKVDAATRISKHLAIEPGDLFYCYMRNSIPDSGVCHDGTRFFFHGLGCSISFPDTDVQVDLEFGPGGSIDAVSKETLCHFLGYSLDDCDSLVQFLLAHGLIQGPNAGYDGAAVGDDDIRRELDASVEDRFLLATTY